MLGGHRLERAGVDRLGLCRRHDQHRRDVRLLPGALDRPGRPDELWLGLVVRRNQQQPRLGWRLGPGRRARWRFLPERKLLRLLPLQLLRCVRHGDHRQLSPQRLRRGTGCVRARRTRDHLLGVQLRPGRPGPLRWDLGIRFGRQQRQRQPGRSAALLRSGVFKRRVVFAGLLRIRFVVHRVGARVGTESQRTRAARPGSRPGYRATQRNPGCRFR